MHRGSGRLRLLRDSRGPRADSVRIALACGHVPNDDPRLPGVLSTVGGERTDWYDGRLWHYALTGTSMVARGAESDGLAQGAFTQEGGVLTLNRPTSAEEVNSLVPNRRDRLEGFWT